MRLSLITMLLLFSSLLFSQKKDEIPAFGKVDKSELQMNECDFDKNAEAVVLFDVEAINFKIYTYSAYTEITHHVRIKILKNKGLGRADIRIPYLSYAKTESISNLNAQTYNLDASGNIVVTKLDKKSIFTKDLNRRISEKIFTFPEVKVGSVIEYSYEVLGTLSSGLRNWNFQKSIPVKLSRYTLDFPSDLEMVSRPICTLPVDKKNVTTAVHTVNTFTMTNIPAIRDEPFISCEDDYAQRVETKVVALTYMGRRIDLTRSWVGIVNSMMEDEDFGKQLTKNIPRTSDLDEMLKKVTDPYQKMVIIYRYVRKNMEWNGHTNIWAFEGVKSAWKQKKGTSGEINLILINLLKDANLDAYPILVSTRANGRINSYNPGYNQFDKVMAYVLINEKYYVLDATNKYASPKLIPWEVMSSEGLVIEKFDTFKWGWQTIWDDKAIFNDVVLVNGVVNEEGVLTGEATISSNDYSRSKRLPDLKEGKEKFTEKYFSSPNPSLKIDSILIQNEEIDTMPLVQKLSFSENLSASGGYKYFSTNLFTGLEKNPFTAENRFSDVFFGANQQYYIIENFYIPDDFAFDELPKSIRMMLPDTSVVFTRLIQAEEDHISLRIELGFKKPLFTVEDYPDFREFYKKLFTLLNEQVVIKKKK